MSLITVKKEETLTVRLTHEHKELLRMAANFKGQDLTNYVMGNILEKALRDIQEFKTVEKLVLSEKDWNLLTNSDETMPSKRTKAKVKAYKKKYP